MGERSQRVPVRLEQQDEDYQRAEAEEQEQEDAKQGKVQAESLGHNTKANTEPQQYKCGTCGKTYKTLKGLERHTKKVHEVP